MEKQRKAEKSRRAEVAPATSPGRPKILSRSSLEAYAFGGIGIILQVFKMNPLLRAFLTLTLCFIVADFCWRSPWTYALSRRVKGSLGGVVIALILVGEWSSYRDEFNSWIEAHIFSKTPETQLVISLDPAVRDPGPELPVIDAMLRIQNSGDMVDKNLYVRLQAPPIQNVIIDQPDRVQLIGGNRGWILSPTANLELKIPELLAHEVRTVYVFIKEEANRANNWKCYIRSDNYPKGREAVWPQEHSTGNGVDFMRFHYTQGEARPTGPAARPSCRVCHLP